MPSNIPPGYSDDGDAATHGRDLAIYQELGTAMEKFQSWRTRNADQFYNDFQKQFASIIEDQMQLLLDDLCQPL